MYGWLYNAKSLKKDLIQHPKFDINLQQLVKKSCHLLTYKRSKQDHKNVKFAGFEKYSQVLLLHSFIHKIACCEILAENHYFMLICLFGMPQSHNGWTIKEKNILQLLARYCGTCKHLTSTTKETVYVISRLLTAFFMVIQFKVGHSGMFF